MNIKKVWLHTGDDSGLTTLSIESSNAMNDYMRVKADENLFPAKPTPENPLRHTVVLGLFDRDDLWTLKEAIDKHLGIL